MAKAVFCMVNSQDHAALVIKHLKEAGFAEDSISAILPERKGSLDFALRHGTKAPEGATTGVSTGGLVGAALGWIAGMGTLAIPGIGPLVAAGPIISALSGAAVGAALGGVAGALVGLGIPEFEAKLYEGKVKAGGILIAVRCRDSDQGHAAREILHDDGAHDITSADTVQVKGKRHKRGHDADHHETAGRRESHPPAFGP
jgi:hypothetical protein